MQLALDPLEFIQRLVQQIPDPRQHLLRYYGSCANRTRRLYRVDGNSPADTVHELTPSGSTGGGVAGGKDKPE
jgi:hypothetical protein